MLLRLNDILSDPMQFLISLLLMLPGACLAISVHESAHGWVAEKCGDPTARYAGRITLNPAKHFDPIGFLAMLFIGFGWAKPVPVNPLQYRHYRRDDIKVSLAGIAANFCLFLICVILVASIFMINLSVMPTYEGDYDYYIDIQNREYQAVIAVLSDEPLANKFMLESPDGSKHLVCLQEGTWEYVDSGKTLYYGTLNGYDADSKKLVLADDNVSLFSTEGLAEFFYAFTGEFSVILYGKVLSVFVRALIYCMFINISLAIFNLIPIPPLDGYHVLNDLVLKQDLFAQRRTQQICMIVLMALIFVGHIKPEWDIISKAIGWVIETVLGGVGSLISALSAALGVL